METSFGTTNQETSFQGVPFIFPPVGDIGPPFISTSKLLGLLIVLLVWLFSNLVILDAPNVLVVNSLPQDNQPQIDPLTFSSNASSSTASS